MDKIIFNVLLEPGMVFFQDKNAQSKRILSYKSANPSSGNKLDIISASPLLSIPLYSIPFFKLCLLQRLIVKLERHES